MESLEANLVETAINYHGQQLQKVWESDRGESELMKLNIRDRLHFDVYNRRAKHFSFQDRGKRLKLHQFIVKKADTLYWTDSGGSKPTGEDINESPTEDMYAIMPPLETYMNIDRTSRLTYFFNEVKVGSLILGTIASKTQSGMMLKVLCTAGHSANVHYVADINVKAFCPVSNVIPAIDRKGVTRSYMMNDSVCCEVLEVIPDTDKMVCGMKGVTRASLGPETPEPRPALGLITAEDFPLAYKKALEHKNDAYETVLEKSVGFNNPNSIAYLMKQMGIDGHFSNMKGLIGRFPEPEYAYELRQQQASKWAYSNVADGIDHFKAGRHTEAFQCLNKALSIDPKNVEGLVARGALYANNGNFQKAIEDFETALKLNPNHVNARKYMGETLVALGRSYEEESKFEEARKAYQSCLTIVPFHEEATNSLEFLKNKTNQASKNLIEPTDLLLPNLSSIAMKPSTILGGTDVNDTLKQLLKNEEAGAADGSGKKDKDKKKKKKSKKKKSRRRSSSSSSSSSSNSNESSSSSSSSSSDSSSSSGDSDFKKRKKTKTGRSRREKQSSLSPLSKRMAMMDPTHDTPTTYQFNKPAAQGTLEFALEQQQIQQQRAVPVAEPLDSYETKVRAFLEGTKGDSDYEDKVRKFLEESAKWKKDKSTTGSGRDDAVKKSSKKKKKKEKKAKREASRRKRKDKKLRRTMQELSEFELRDVIKKELGIKDTKKLSKKLVGLTSDDDDYLLKKTGYSKRFLDSLPDLEELESKLNAYYARESLENKSFAQSPFKSDMSESPQQQPHSAHRHSHSPSPTREQKARAAVAEAAAFSTHKKWMMQMGAGGTSVGQQQAVSAQAAASGSRFKRRGGGNGGGPDDWMEEQHLGQQSMVDLGGQNTRRNKSGDMVIDDDLDMMPNRKQGHMSSALPPPDKNMSVRKVMALKEPQPLIMQKKPSIDHAQLNDLISNKVGPPLGSNKKQQPQPPPLPPNIPMITTYHTGHTPHSLSGLSKPVPQGQVVLDKFGNFRLVTPPKSGDKSGMGRLDEMPPLPPGQPPKPGIGGVYGSDRVYYIGSSGRNKPPEPPGRPRSDSRSPAPNQGAAGAGGRRSRSRPGRYSRSRSSSGAGGGGGSRSRSRSRYSRSRSRSYYSRSRSRSGSYYSRSRSRSRSYSGDRRRRRGGFRGRFNDRGTYYKPRFQNPRHGGFRGGRGGGGGPGGGYRDRFDHRDFRGGRGRPFYNRQHQSAPYIMTHQPNFDGNHQMRYMNIDRRPRGRFQRGGGNNYRDYRDRRYDRSRSRDRSRSYSVSPRRSNSPDSNRERDRSTRENSVPKTNNHQEETRTTSGTIENNGGGGSKINKYAAGNSDPAVVGEEGNTAGTGGGSEHSAGAIRHEGPLSEGEDRDDYNITTTATSAAGGGGVVGSDTSGDKFVDREVYGGKWSNKGRDRDGDEDDEGDRRVDRERDDKRRSDIDDERPPGTEDIPNETNIEAMDKFLNKVKEKKREEMQERNKDILKA